MEKRFERTLSQILSIMVLIVFLTTLITLNMNVWVITYIWAVSFLIAWVLMLIYALHVLLQGKSYGLSVLVAILTAIAFGLLSVPAILVLARFIPQMPAGLTFGVSLLDQNNQFVLYTSLIVVYFAHLINVTSLGRKINEQEIAHKVIDSTELDNQDEAEVIETVEITESNPAETEVITETADIKKDINNSEISIDKTNIDSEDDNIEPKQVNISSEDLIIGEKIVFESNIDEKEEYNIDNIKLVEDLTKEELDEIRKEERNG